MLLPILSLFLTSAFAVSSSAQVLRVDFDGSDKASGESDVLLMEKIRPAVWDMTIRTPEAKAAPEPPKSPAGKPDAWNAFAVRRLAHELEDAATLLHERYRQVSDGWKWWHWQGRFDALNALSPLAGAARHLNAQLAGNDKSPAPTRQDFHSITRWLEQARAKLPGAYRSERVASEFQSVQGLYAELAAYYRLPEQPERGWKHWEKVRELARSVDGKLTSLMREVERRATFGDYWERRALAELRQFEAQARHFRLLLEQERDHQNSRRSAGDFSFLLKTRDQAAFSLGQAHFEPYVREDFAEISNAILELESYYKDGKKVQ